MIVSSKSSEPSTKQHYWRFHWRSWDVSTKIGSFITILMMYYVNVWWTSRLLLSWFNFRLESRVTFDWTWCFHRFWEEKRRKFPAIFIVMGRISDKSGRYFSCSDPFALSSVQDHYISPCSHEFKFLILTRFSWCNKWFHQSEIGKLLKAILNRNCLLEMNNYL